MPLVFLCIKIFFARIADVTVGTVRTMIMIKGKTVLTGVLAFIEVFIWFLVAREALVTEVNSFWIPISYSLGYATGTLLGSYLSQRFIRGVVGVQVVVPKENKKLIKTLRDHGFACSVMDLKDDYEGNKKDMLFLQVNNRSLKKVTNLIKKMEPNAFVVVNETKAVQNGYFK